MVERKSVYPSSEPVAHGRAATGGGRAAQRVRGGTRPPSPGGARGLGHRTGTHGLGSYVKKPTLSPSPRRSCPRRRGDGVCARPGPRGAGLTEWRVTRRVPAEESGPAGRCSPPTAGGPREEGKDRRERTRPCQGPAPSVAPAQRQPRGLGAGAPALRCSVTSAQSHREPALQELVSGRPSSAASRALACRWARAALECRHLGDPQRQLNSLPLMSQKRCP